ncbi:MAG: bacillithiol biosynthesis deacetylase BshB1 [Gemmatimonadota bacterium]|nr:bacillithiol biosynthesis deacetylase BshB1 [Gemmatimonadota bacterium]
MTRTDHPPEVDVLAIAAHQDDVELTCGGTLLRCVEQGYRTGAIDLTKGEMGTRGSAELRAEEAERAAEVLGLAVRWNAGLPDAGVVNSPESRERLVTMIRRLRPRVVILPFSRGRHPDHRVTAELGRDACFLAGLARYGSREAPAHKPHKLLYALSYREDPVKPTFVVRLEEEHFRRKMEAIRCYASQFDATDSAGEIFPTGQPLYELVETQARHYGSLIRSPYGEPYYTDETVRVDDVVQLPVRSL